MTELDPTSLITRLVSYNKIFSEHKTRISVLVNLIKKLPEI